MQEELSFLWHTERRKVVAAITIAAAEGDRSENAEYIYGKKRLREIDKRIQHLTQRIDKAIIVDVSQIKNDKIFFGSIITLENEAGKLVTYQILGPDEIDATKNKISMDSPVGRALLGKTIDDEIEVLIPKGSIYYRIVKIETQNRFRK